MKFFPNARRFDGVPPPTQAAENDDGFPPSVADDDAGLVARTGGGDAKAFAILVGRHSPALYRVAYRMLRDGAEAEDVVQECFARLWSAAPNWRPRGTGLVGWLHRVAMNLCLDRLRKPKAEVAEAFPEPVDGALLQDRRIEGREMRSAVENALAALPSHYRAALVLSYYEGFPNAVAAETMDMNVKALESLLVRARRQLRKLLELQDFASADVETLQ